MTDPLLRMTRVSKRFGAVTALAGVSIDVVEGEVHALCGENGAGKSTLMTLRSGVYPAGSYEGSIELEGAEVRFRPLSES